MTFAVSEEKNKWLQNAMEELGISEADIEERFVRLEQETIGPGGHERYVALVGDLERAVGIASAAGV